MKKLVLVLLLIATVAPFTEARGRTSSPRSTTRIATKRPTTQTAKSKATKCTSCGRDSKGRIARSTSAKHDFQKAHPCPATGKTSGSCPGYVTDHVVPLKRGGADSPSNMQWMTIAAAKAQDRVE
jgi:hypothetical protein